MKKYAFWNNKGGVGKTFLCFATAAEYARQNPRERVVVIDMCPQANISEILLGGNSTGAERLDKMLVENKQRRTIGGYFDQRIKSPHAKTGVESEMIVRVADHNVNNGVPDNLYLIAGDPSLEWQAQTVSVFANQELPQDAWRNVHRWILDLQDAARAKMGDCAFFIDCNPSFSVYTGQAILAADRIVAPCTADTSSARAIRNLFHLVYGMGMPPEYAKASFNAKIEDSGMSAPKLHAIPMNRSTTYANRPARAFDAMFAKIKNEVRARFDSRGDCFSVSSSGDIFVDIPDAHTVAIVASYKGIPIAALPPGPHTLGDDDTTTIVADTLEKYKQRLGELVERL